MNLNLNEAELAFWKSYVNSLDADPRPALVQASIAGNDEIADKLLDLYLDGKKSAGSGLVADYVQAGEELPKVGDFWIILDGRKRPRCIVKTVRVSICPFDEVPEEVAIAEGEGDLSLEYWRKAHAAFFAPYLEAWGVSDLNKAELVTSFYDVVFK